MSDPVREDFIDYPTGWAIQREFGTDCPPHDIRCSCVDKSKAICPKCSHQHAAEDCLECECAAYFAARFVDGMAGPAFLCDCKAMPREWRRRVLEQAAGRQDYEAVLANADKYLEQWKD